MYCHHCGKKQPEDAVYCNQCGRLLQPEDGRAPLEPEQGPEQQEAAAGVESGLSAVPDREGGLLPSSVQAVRPDERKKSPGWLIWGLIPFAVLVLSAGGVFAYYVHEDNVNSEVREWHMQAQQAGLAGDYESAMKLLKQASSKRPAYEAVQQDIVAVQKALQDKSSLQQISGLMDNNSLNEAELQLEQLRSKLLVQEGTLFEPIRAELEQLNVKLEVQKAENELDSLNTVDALAAKYKEVQPLTGAAAEALQAKLKDKIAAVSNKEASSLLAAKKFTEALAAVQSGLDYEPGNEPLLKLQEQIKQQKQQFEDAEQARIEHAMQIAAEEDLRNHTSAVEVVRLEQTLDDNGNLIVTGHLKNSATRPIYTVKVQFTVSSLEGELLAAGEADAAPNYVEPGDEMTFTWASPDIKQSDVKVVVDHATWYLD
ncbi:zinc-ribbon domain-containing protein [Paenibacillus protaetiae]|uniref:Zinc ribbon domain-containing protein n=1 Tax=Paenibacillus protaetiae TaxID=2509456 RepID=A0A4P6F9E1_9BACL|nr:zinc ribbon domain-containing protein [Paenibacillus protaetiae]QAY67098.1 zinc ribbon domain-containing protein [Paenibacillus protaetiae]